MGCKWGSCHPHFPDKRRRLIGLPSLHNKPKGLESAVGHLFRTTPSSFCCPTEGEDSNHNIEVREGPFSGRFPSCYPIALIRRIPGCDAWIKSMMPISIRHPDGGRTWLCFVEFFWGKNIRGLPHALFRRRNRLNSLFFPLEPAESLTHYYGHPTAPDAYEFFGKGKTQRYVVVAVTMFLKHCFIDDEVSAFAKDAKNRPGNIGIDIICLGSRLSHSETLPNPGPSRRNPTHLWQSVSPAPRSGDNNKATEFNSFESMAPRPSELPS